MRGRIEPAGSAILDRMALDLLGHFASHGRLFEDKAEPAVG
jgi:hypothetical protein